MEGLVVYLLVWLVFWFLSTIFMAKRVEDWQADGLTYTALNGLIFLVWPLVLVAGLVWVLSTKIAGKE